MRATQHGGAFDMPDDATPAQLQIAEFIRSEGAITFDTFMQLALYGEYGYYTNAANAGADYTTSPQMHPGFGSLIAGYLYRAWLSLDQPSPFDVIELGAGDATLAADITGAIEGRDDLSEFRTALRYRAFDVCVRYSQAQHVEVCPIGELSLIDPIVGCILSNELIDAFPTHAFSIRNGKVLERYVVVDDAGIVRFIEAEPSSSEIADRVKDFVPHLPDGYLGEANLRIDDWASETTRALRRGYVLTIDYGHERSQLYHPARTEGSLRSYNDHVLGRDPFRKIGIQDLTTHVDFTALGDAMSTCGLVESHPLQSQRDFLYDVGIDTYIRQIRLQLAQSRDLSEVDSLQRELRSLNALVDSRSLGGFKVAQQAKDAPPVDLTGLDGEPIFSLPRPRPRHVSFHPQ